MSDAVLHDRPVLALDPGMHTAPIIRADIDRDGRFAVTGSHDKSVRVWSLADGALQRTIRLPAGPGNVGKVYAVAISPDGTTIAAGGWTRWTEAQQIYLFDRASGEMTGRIGVLPDCVGDLAFSRDGERLAAVLCAGGMRLYARDKGRWSELASDTDYGDQSYGVAFAADGRLATTSIDGRLRLYDADGRLLSQQVATRAQPIGLAFNPVDGRLAVGFRHPINVALYDGATLAPPDLGGIDNGLLGIVAWSADGVTLFAAGNYWDGSGCPVVAWDGGAQPTRFLPAGASTVMSLRPLPDGTLFAAAVDPWLGVIATDGTPRWTRGPKQIEPRGQRSNFAVSADGTLVEFGPTLWGKEDRLRFDMATLKLSPSADDGRVAPPVHDTLAVAGWIDTPAPTVDGARLRLDPYEGSRSLAIHPNRDRFLLGTEWSLRAFDKAGAALWRRPVPGIVWAVNVSGDGRLAVAAYGDGTLRWHRMEDGVELLAIFPLPDKENWVAWTPEGIYAANPGAVQILHWHVNHGWDAAGEAHPASAIPETNRPDVIPYVLPHLGTGGAIAAAERSRIRGLLHRGSPGDVAPPRARLHVLAIGVSDYGAAARHLDLAYADNDARDVAAVLRHSQSSLYDQVLVSELVNAAATRENIIRELRATRDLMRTGNGSDLAVILFSGHGELVDGDRFYLLPHGADVSSAAAIKATALSATDFHDEIAAIAQHGRAILFIDAGRYGGATAMLAAPNLAVFASSSAGELSVERSDLENGAFTEALLEALCLDPDGDGMIRVSDLARYLSARVPELSDGLQHPDIEVRFDAALFAAPEAALAGVIELAETRDAVQRAVGSENAPGPRLHVLAIGVSDFGPAAGHLKLNYAAQDAQDVAAALTTSQAGRGRLYGKVLPSELLNARATKEMIITELGALRDAMNQGGGHDTAIILFSGHGEKIDGGDFYLMPHDVDTSSPATIETTALQVAQFQSKIAAVAQHGHVLVLIDACRSGGATDPLGRLLGDLGKMANLTTFTSCTAEQMSLEDAAWQNGAFTEALLDAFRQADADRDGRIWVSDLSRHISKRVPALTGGKQRPSVEIHFDTEILAAIV